MLSKLSVDICSWKSDVSPKGIKNAFVIGQCFQYELKGTLRKGPFPLIVQKSRLPTNADSRTNTNLKRLRNNFFLFSCHFFFFPPSPANVGAAKGPGGGGEGGGWGGEGGLTNERSQTDHVITGPMRGLKNGMGRGKNSHTDTQTDRHTDFPTTRPPRPQGPIWGKSKFLQYVCML